MLYYLDTNIIYNLRHLPEHIAKTSYTSFLAILEIVAGINERNYSQRRAALAGIIDRQLTVDWRTTDMIIFDSFNAYSDFDMSDSNVVNLQNTMLTCVSTDSYSNFSKIFISNVTAIEYFKSIDSHITQKFTGSFPELLPVIRKSALVHTFTSGDINIKVDFTEAIKATYIDDDKHARLVKNLAAGCQFIIKNSCAPDKPEYQIEDVIPSYNEGADFFICAWLAYELKNIGVGNLPGRNDFQDLLHFLYLRNYLDRKIISDDAIYRQLAPEYTITLQALIGESEVS